MEKKKIVLVDTDEEYLSVLVYKFVEEWGDEAEIEVITQLRYFNEYFNQPRNIFLLVINEILFSYEEKLKKQNISHIFLLSEEDQVSSAVYDGKRNCQTLYKYSSVKDIFARIHREVWSSFHSSGVIETEVVLVSSIDGGVGKTLCALGISQTLTDMGRRVLYISTETIQDFCYYINNPEWMDADYAYSMAVNDSRVITDIGMATGQSNFDYLKALPRMSLVYQIKSESYVFLVSRIKQENLYDVILVELPRQLDSSLIKLFEICGKVIMVTGQNSISSVKLDVFIQSLTVSLDRYIFICGRFDKMKPNALSENVYIRQNEVAAYIPEDKEGMTPEKMMDGQWLQPVAYMI